MVDEVVAQAPVFVSKIKDVNVHEGQPAHFDCRIEPIGDGSMQVKLSNYVPAQYQTLSILTLSPF